MRIIVCLLGLIFSLPAQTKVPKIWDDRALEDWATPIAALGVRPGHYTSAEYYAVPGDNLKTYPVYRPDRDRVLGLLQKQKPQPLVDASELRTPSDWIKAGETAFRIMDHVDTRTGDPQLIRAIRDPKSLEGIWTKPDGSLHHQRWVVTSEGVQLSLQACGGGGCHFPQQQSCFLGHPRQLPSEAIQAAQCTFTNRAGLACFPLPR